MSSPPRPPGRPTWCSDSHAHYSPPQTPLRPPRIEQPPPSLRASRRHERIRHQEQTDVRELERRATQEKQLRLFRMKRQKKRDIWQFVCLVAKDKYEHVPDDQLSNIHAKSAYCLKCDSFLEFKQGRHTVKQHMEVYHPEDLVAFAEMMIPANHDKPLARNISMELAEVANPRKSCNEITPNQQKHMNKLLATWVACHYRPMVLVEDAGFIQFVRFITEDVGNVKVKLPKRTQLRHEIEVLAADLRKKVKEDISGCCKYYSITTDIWSSRNARSYISLTIHYVTDEFYPRNWTLEVIELPGIHDGEAIARALSKMMEDWSLMREYCIRMLSDSGANVVV